MIFATEGKEVHENFLFYLCVLCGQLKIPYVFPLEQKSSLILLCRVGYSLQHEQFRPNNGRSPHRHGPSP